MLNSVVKISMMSAKYFEYYTIILRGTVLSWTHCISEGKLPLSPELMPVHLLKSYEEVLRLELCLANLEKGFDSDDHSHILQNRRADSAKPPIHHNCPDHLRFL